MSFRRGCWRFGFVMPTDKLGEQIRRLRQRRRLSLRYVATKANITAPYLSDIELGRRHPSERVMTDLAKVLRTPLDELQEHDPKAIVDEVQRRMESDARFGPALRLLLRRCATTDQLLALVDSG